MSLPGQRLLVLNGWLAERARAHARAPPPHPHSDDGVPVVRRTKDSMSAALHRAKRAWRPAKQPAAPEGRWNLVFSHRHAGTEIVLCGIRNGDKD
jgi:hypothetical protein